MKIKSCTDVITNSSSEVFVLNTAYSCEEVLAWLKENVKWSWGDEEGYPFTEPEIFENSGLDEELIDFGYMWDSNDPQHIENYEIRYCLNYGETSYNDQYDFRIKHDGLRVKRMWEKFCEDNMEEVIKAADSPHIKTADDFWDAYYRELKYFSTYLFPCNWWTCKYDYVIKKFIDEYKERFPAPDWWKIPAECDVNTYKGRIAFETVTDNSIAYDDIEEICEKFNGGHWHMG